LKPSHGDTSPLMETQKLCRSGITEKGAIAAPPRS
jgi:hypothetical protein